MTEIYLFDWGDTLMVDFPNTPGKMCDWEVVETIDGAEESLKFLSERSKIYIATGAAQSSKDDIAKAFKRVNLDKYITDYFCKSNLGFDKENPEFFPSILKKLGKISKQVTVVGDNFNKDIKPAIELGMNAILLSKNKRSSKNDSYRTINSLKELCF